MIDITQVVQAVITVIVTLITAVAIPYIKNKTTAAQQENLLFWVKIAVQAAEQLYQESGQGQTKKEYVLKFLNEHGLTYDTAAVETMIEAAVKELTN